MGTDFSFCPNQQAQKPNFQPNKQSMDITNPTKKIKLTNFQGLPLRPPPLQSQDVAIIPKTPSLAASTALSGFYATEDHPLNKKGFRYASCCANPTLDKVLYSLAEVQPFGPRISFEDRSPNVFISNDAVSCTTSDGYRSARANVGVSSGKWYVEFVVEKANLPDNDAHVRIGWTRREASLETPVGHDAYGYGLRDTTGQKVHLSRPKAFMNEGFSSGDVIGMLINIPPDRSSNPQIVRDRIPIRYKGQLLFEILDYVPIKPMDELILPTNLFKKKREVYVPPVIAGSFIQVFKNGKNVGKAFEDLVDFRPPNSKYPSHVAKSSIVASDDGNLGYFPTISVFRGGTAKFNFGPTWICPPEDLNDVIGVEKEIKPLCCRYDEQIAEDVVYDIIDQIAFEVQDGKLKWGI